MADLPSVSTKLEAINTMLGAIGSSPVQSLTVSVDGDVTTALTILDETLKEVLSQGWDFNTDTRYPIARTIDNEYLVPSNVAAIDVSDEHPEVRATQRAGKMWDQENHTFTWDRDLTFNITWLFPFDELPQTAKNYIALKAARRFQGRALGSDNLGKYAENDEMEARTIFLDAEGVDAQHNILTGNYAVYRVLNRRV
ncbi:MAG: hypothetical protein EPO10_22775 [Reyranella sp.]|uniref:hypothetical protein n=1 Tax=Reyranella sp. TaxID=1929291 RepID=UPI001216447C|nr:hypothetical protein [Reyranella sp.]TAJ97148.1 MAG: hypothetical protein EPO41_03920 [Reyranella sp.]TBR26515.1 MAG: hypothetical protein EPO10_22775 [Reyranella sp.]